MKQLFINNVKLLNAASEVEKQSAYIMYVTSFIMMMRSGQLYRKENGKDGIAQYVINIDGMDYKCPEPIILYLLKDSLKLIPYEDTSTDLIDTCALPKVKYNTEYAFNESGTKNKGAVGEKLNEVAGKAGEKLSEVAEKAGEKFAETTQAASEITSEVKDAMKEELPPIEITLSKEEQADLLLEETEYYKVGAGLNLAMCTLCIVMMVVITMISW